eukprot:8050398-Pyramimonas_sp.AAC.2
MTEDGLAGVGYVVCPVDTVRWRAGIRWCGHVCEDLGGPQVAVEVAAWDISSSQVIVRRHRHARMARAARVPRAHARQRVPG